MFLLFIYYYCSFLIITNLESVIPIRKAGYSKLITKNINLKRFPAFVSNESVNKL